MRSEKEMMDLVLSLAEQDERIRIVTLEGSRANINIPKDEFQDYDITYFVSDIEPFIFSILLHLLFCRYNQHHWASHFIRHPRNIHHVLWRLWLHNLIYYKTI